MKLKNISSLPVQIHDEHAGRGALVAPGGETPELSELAYRELAELTATWAPVEGEPVRTSGSTQSKKKRGS